MEIQAPAHWQAVDFLSDLHLDRPDAPTLTAFAHYLEHSPAQALFVLGDLFEVWVGDDALGIDGGVEQRVAALLHRASLRMDIFILCGNRDFLMGPALMQACGAQALPDPSVLQFGDQRYLLTHGDGLCLSDTDYLAFRQLARSTTWQQNFLSQPLSQRQASARNMRMQSQAHQAAMRARDNTRWHDLDTQACLQSLHQAQADTMIHGHTHHPATHPLAPGKSRWVLSDWDLQCEPPRGDLLRLTRVGAPQDAAHAGPALQRLSVSGLNA